MVAKLIPSRMKLVDEQGFATPEFFRAMRPVEVLVNDGVTVDASNVTSTPTGDVSATNVQDAIAELASEKATIANLDAHITDATDAHDASAISNIPAGGIAATDVQAALNELDADKEVAGAAAAAVAAHVALPDPHSQYLTATEGDGAYQPLDADLTSWAGVTRAAGFDAFAATPNSVNLKALVTDETGSGALVFATSPTLVTPALGTPASGTLTNCTFPTLNQSTTGTAANVTGVVLGANGGTGIANTGKTITLGGNLTTAGAFASTFTMTAATGVTFPTTGTLATLTDVAAKQDTLVSATNIKTINGSTVLGAGNLSTAGYGYVYPLMNWGGKNFNGTTTYLVTNPLTGVVDGKAGSFVAILRFANAATVAENLWISTGPAMQISRTAVGNISIVGKNAAAATIMQLSTSGAPCAAAGTYVIMASWDLAGAGAKLYINEVSSLTTTTYTNDTIDYTVSNNALGATIGGASFFVGDWYALWIDFTQQLDWSTESVRRKFIDANRVPVYLGARGELPTGTAPGLFHGYDDIGSWHLNRGSLQATSWTQNGAAATATTALSGQFAPLRDFDRTVTTTSAAYTVGRTDYLVIVNVGAACVLTLPDAASSQGRELRILNIGGAFATTSASSNVVPLAGGAAGTALLAATDGVGCLLKASGASWQIVDN